MTELIIQEIIAYRRYGDMTWSHEVFFTVRNRDLTGEMYFQQYGYKRTVDHEKWKVSQEGLIDPKVDHPDLIEEQIYNEQD